MEATDNFVIDVVSMTLFPAVEELQEIVDSGNRSNEAFRNIRYALDEKDEVTISRILFEGLRFIPIIHATDPSERKDIATVIVAMRTLEMVEDERASSKV